MPDIKLVKEAQKTIAQIKQFQATSTDKLANMDRQIADLEQAQKKMQIAAAKPKAIEFAGDHVFKKYIKADGSIRLNNEKKKLQIANEGLFETQIDGFLTPDKPANEWHAKLCKLNQERNWVKMVTRGSSSPATTRKIAKHLETAPREIKDQLKKAFYDDGASGADGGAWFHSEFRNDIYQTAQVPMNIRAQIPVQTMQGNTLIVPRMARSGAPFIGGKVTSDNNNALARASTVETQQKTVSIKPLKVRYVFDENALEESSLALLSIMSKEIVTDLEAGWEDAFFNSCLGTHIDAISTWSPRGRWPTATLGGADDHRRMWNGMRARAFSSSLANSAGVPSSSALATTADMLGRISVMGESGVGEMMICVSPEVMIKHLVANSDLLSISSFGDRATLLQGQVFELFGHPVFTSRYLTSDLHSSGKFTGSGTTSSMMFINRSSFYQFQQNNAITVRQSENIDVGSVSLVASMKTMVDSLDADSTKNVALLYNLDS